MKLTCKYSKFMWMTKCEANFEELKRQLTITPVLSLLVGDKGFKIYNDDLYVGLGCQYAQGQGASLCFTAIETK